MINVTSFIAKWDIIGDKFVKVDVFCLHMLALGANIDEDR